MIPDDSHVLQAATDTQFLEAIDKHWHVYCFPPSIRWLKKTLGYHSENSIWKIVHRLNQEGRICIFQGKIVPNWVSDFIYGHAGK